MSDSMTIMSSFQMMRSNPAHMGNSPLISTAGVASGIAGTDKDTKKTERTSFSNYLIDAANYVNDTQQASSSMVEKLVTDPDSVDVQDVTIAMAEANLSLSIAQTVIERVTKAWSEITSTR